MTQVIGYPQGGALLSGTNESAAPLPVGYNRLPEFGGVGAAAVPVMATMSPGGGTGIRNILSLTQAQYDALAAKDPATLYVIMPMRV